MCLPLLLYEPTTRSKRHSWSCRFGGLAAGRGDRPGRLVVLIDHDGRRGFVHGDRHRVGRDTFVHAYYDPHLPLHQQKWGGLRWLSLPSAPLPHYSGKVAIVGHTPQKNGELLDLGYLKCIDTFCHGGGWLTALEVEGGRRVWQANEAGELRG